jgi:quercetin dioxygenase-like cupin family protein
MSDTISAVMNHRAFSSLFLPILLLLGVTAGWAEDAAQVSPDYKVEIDNAWVRVLRVRHPPHAKIPLHEHPNAVGVALTDVHEKITGTDGRPRNVDRKAGEVSFSPAGAHTEENVSDQPLEAVIIELKSGAPKSPPISRDPVKLDPTHHIVLLENDRVRVLRTILEPHVKSPMHQHPHYVVVYLTELHTTMKLGDGRVVDNPRHPGEIAWRDALEHQTEQMGDETAVEIQVEIK